MVGVKGLRSLQDSRKLGPTNVPTWEMQSPVTYMFQMGVPFWKNLGPTLGMGVLSLSTSVIIDRFVDRVF